MSIGPTEEEIAVLRAAQLADLIGDQAGVVSRAQLLHGGLTSEEIRRRTRRRELVRVHPRVYVTHTGPLTWTQRAWAALLYAGRGAALCGVSLDPTERDAEPVHVAIDQQRRVMPTMGVVLHRVSRLRDQVFAGSEPLRLRFEDNALLISGQLDSELEVIATLAKVVGRRGVTAASLRIALPRHPRVRHRAFINRLIDDLVAGTASVLEHAYLERVERAHMLPVATRQLVRRTADGRRYRDAVYEAFALVVELDGRLGHDSWDGIGRDADRDLDDLALHGSVTAHLRWQQVFDTPCRTALRIALILRARGWRGTPRPCGPGCVIRPT